jgi:hypothetical protein
VKSRDQTRSEKENFDLKSIIVSYENTFYVIKKLEGL